MKRETDFVQQNSERATHAAALGMSWARELAEASFVQSQKVFDGLLHVTRKVAEDWQSQAAAIRERTSEVTQKSLSNTIEFGQKLTHAKEPQEFVQCQSEYLARQAQTLADGTKAFSEHMQHATRNFAENASNSMAEASRRA